MPSQSVQLRMHPDVLKIVRPDGSSWLLHMSANACRLDVHSTSLLHALLHDGPELAIRNLAAQFGLAEPEARADVESFAGGLLRERMLVRGDASRAAAPRRRGGARRLAVLLLGLLDRPGRSLEVRARRLLIAARLAVAWLGWARTVEVWERCYPQPDASHPEVAGSVLAAIDSAVRVHAARSFLHLECKERALACLAMARAARIRAELVVGLTYVPLESHVWVECGGRIISDHPEHCRPFEAVARYGGVPRAEAS